MDGRTCFSLEPTGAALSEWAGTCHGCRQHRDVKEDSLHTREAGGLWRPPKGPARSKASSPCVGQTHAPDRREAGGGARGSPPFTDQNLSAREHTCCCLVPKSRLTVLRPHELQPARLLGPWDFPGKDAGRGLPFLSLGPPPRVLLFLL